MTRKDPHLPTRQGRKNRPYRHEVALTEEQENSLQARARQAGVTPSKYLADGATAASSAQRQATNIKLAETVRILGGAASNMNQVARVANTNKAADRAVIAVMQAGAQELRDLAGRVLAEAERLR